MNKLVKTAAVFTLLIPMLALQGCSPEVGSDEWCADMKEKSQGDWTVNEAADFAKNCILK